MPRGEWSSLRGCRRAPVELPSRSMFLSEPPPSDAQAAANAEDRDEDGYVNNLTRLWCWRPDVLTSFVEFRSGLMEGSALTPRDWAVLVTATASARDDSYCSLAWGARLARLTDDETAARVILGEDAAALSEREAALADWGRQVVRQPDATPP